MAFLARIFIGLLLLSGMAHSEPPKVMTDIAPVHSLVAQVMGDLGEPELLLQASDDIHHLQLRPSQAHAIARADVVIWVGPGLEPWLAESLAALNPGAVSLALQNQDAHGWLDPVAASTWLSLIAAVLADTDPDNAEQYGANADQAVDRIAELVEDVHTTLAPVLGQGFVVDHDAYGPFANRFELNILASLRDGEAAQPGAGRLAQVRKLIEAGQVNCVFADTGHSEQLAMTIAADTNVAVASLDAMGLGLTPGPEMYHDLIRNIAAAFRECDATP